MKKKISKEQKDLFGSIIIFLYFLGLLYMTSQINVSFSANVGWANAKTFPYLFCGLGAIFSVFYIVQSAKKMKDAKSIEGKQQTAEGTETSSWRVFGSIALCIFFVFTVKFLGVIVGGAIYLAAQILILLPKEKRTAKNYIITGAVAVLVPLVVYFPFRYVFDTFLPLGFLKGLF